MNCNIQFVFARYIFKTKNINNVLEQRALFITVNSKGEILIQDRRNYKKPEWGFFGGSIEKSETPLEAVLRETKEELGLDISENDIVPMGTLSTFWRENKEQLRHLFLYRTDQNNFTDYEAKGAHWLSFEVAR